MNAHVALSAYTPTSYASGSYTMSMDDFTEVHGVRTDALSGRQWAFGRNSAGVMVSVLLNVRLCNGCDQPISQHLCTDCELVFLGDPRELVA